MTDCKECQAYGDDWTLDDAGEVKLACDDCPNRQECIEE